MKFLNVFFLIFLCFLVILDIVTVTYLVSSENRKKWILYLFFSILYLSIFSFFKYSNIDIGTVLFYWKQPFMVISYHSVFILSLMAILVVPKFSIKKLSKNKFYIISIFLIFYILFKIY